MLRLARFIPVVLILALLLMSPALAQSGSAARTPESVLLVSDLGKLYYVGSFSSVEDLATHSGICGAFGLVEGSRSCFRKSPGKHLLLAVRVPLT